jgi:hypothetical protein
MPGACWEHRSQLERPEEFVSWPALVPGEQQVSCPSYLVGARQQATVRISATAWLRQWVKGKVRESRLRQLAMRQGLRLTKSRHGDARAGDRIHYGLAAMGSGPLASFAEGMTLDEVEKYLVYGMASAEIIKYLSQTYGSRFVGDLIKHLPQPG